MCGGVNGAGGAGAAGAADLVRSLGSSANNNNAVNAADVSAPQDQVSLILADFQKKLASSGVNLA